MFIPSSPLSVVQTCEPARRAAKKCEALTAKAFPSREVGNPAAGSTKGTGKAEQDYYRKCVANGGKMDDHSGKEAK
jgi:hypothetical protein